MIILKLFILGVALTAPSFATPPPGYIKKQIVEKDPPKYEYGYDVNDGEGGRQGHVESRDGIYAQGVYYVNLPHSGQSVQYFADDWGYHPLVTYGSTSKTGSTNAQIAIGEMAVKALTKSRASSAAAATASESASQNKKHLSRVIVPILNQAAESVVTSSTNNEASLVIGHQPVGVVSGPETASQLVENSQTFASSSGSSNIHNGQQQRLSATFLVDGNAQVDVALGNDVESPQYLVKGSSDERDIASPGQQQAYETDPDIAPGNAQAQSQSSSQQSQDQNQRPARVYASSVGSSYSFGRNGLEYGMKLSALINNQGDRQEGENVNIYNNQERVESISSSPHLSLRPIVVADYQESNNLVSERPEYISKSTPNPQVYIGEDVSSSSYESSTASSFSATSGQYEANNLLDAHVSTHSNLAVTSTPAPALYVSSSPSSSSFAESHAESLVATNYGDSGHIGIELNDATASPQLASSATYLNSPPAAPVGYLSGPSPSPSPSPTPPTIIITPKPQPLAEALISVQGDSIYNSNVAAETSNNLLSEQRPVFAPDSNPHDIAHQLFKNKFKSSTIVEVQKAVPIEFEQEKILTAAEEEQIKHNGIPIDYIQQIVDAAEHAGHNQQGYNFKTVLQGDGLDYGNKLNAVGAQSGYSNEQALVSGVDTRESVQTTKLAPVSNAQFQQVSYSGKLGDQYALNIGGKNEYNQQTVEVGPPRTENDKQLHDDVHNYHKHLLAQIKQESDNTHSSLDSAQQQYNEQIVDQIRNVHPVYKPNVQPVLKVEQLQPHFNLGSFQNDNVQKWVQQDGHRFNQQLLQAQKINNKLRHTHDSLRANQQSQEIVGLRPPNNNRELFKGNAHTTTYESDLIHRPINNYDNFQENQGSYGLQESQQLPQILHVQQEQSNNDNHFQQDQGSYGLQESQQLPQIVQVQQEQSNNAYNDADLLSHQQGHQLNQQLLQANIENEALKQKHISIKSYQQSQQIVDLRPPNVVSDETSHIGILSQEATYPNNQQIFQIDETQQQQQQQQQHYQEERPVYIQQQVELVQKPQEQLQLNPEFLEANQQLLKGEEIQKQQKINEESLQSAHQQHSAGPQFQQHSYQIESLSAPVEAFKNVEVHHTYGQQLNQQLPQSEVNKQQDQQDSVAATQQLVGVINNQKTTLLQQYNQQLLANVVRKPSSSALVQQSINTNHQSTLKFNLQPNVEKQQDVEKDYNQQLVEENKQDVIQNDRGIIQNNGQLKQLLEFEKQPQFNAGAIPQSSIVLQQSPGSLVHDVQLQSLETLPSPQSLVQFNPAEVDNHVPLLQTIPIQQTTHLKQTVTHLSVPSFQQQQEQYYNSAPTVQQHLPIEHTKIVQVDRPVIVNQKVPVVHTKYVERPIHIEHTKYVEVKKPYPVHHTRVVKVDRPVHVPHIVPIEVTKLVAVDRPWPYPQPYPVAVHHPVPYPVNVDHYIPYPVRVPHREQQSVHIHSKQVTPIKLSMPHNPHFQKQAAHAYLKSNYNFVTAQSFNRPQFSNLKNNYFNGQTYSHTSGRNSQRHQLPRNQGWLKNLNIEYGFKPPLIPSIQIPEDPEPEPTSGLKS